MGNTTSNIKITSHDKAILQLKLQRDKLNKSKLKIQSVIDREIIIAKQCIAENKLDKAKLTLRKKKRQESLLNNLERQSDTLEELIDTIEFKLIEKDIIFGLEQGNKVLKEINNELNIERVEKIMDDSIEAINYQNELSDKLGNLLTNGEELEVDDELRKLEIEMGVISDNKETDIKDTNIDKNKLNKLNNLPNVPKIIKQDSIEEGEDEIVENNNEFSKVPQLA